MILPGYTEYGVREINRNYAGINIPDDATNVLNVSYQCLFAFGEQSTNDKTLQ